MQQPQPPASRTALLALACALWALSAASCASQEKPGPAPAAGPRVVVGGTELSVELARTREERRRGLGGREGLAEGTGLLFLYEEARPRFFWMKDMRFAIDIVWIRGDRVVGVDADVAPEPRARSDDDLRHYESPGPVDRVLETPAGFCAQAGIAPGQRVTYRLEPNEGKGG